MQRIADLAGVSRATVSRALANSPLVSEATRTRIQSIASDEGYVLNQSARNFRLGKTRTIGIVMTGGQKSMPHISDPFSLEMIGVIADVLGEYGYNTLIAYERFLSAEQFTRSSIYQQSEGLIFIGQGHQHDELNRLNDAGLPIVVWGSHLLDCRYPVVGSDNVAGGLQATNHLIALGRRRIAFLGDKTLPEMADRYRGFLDALRAAGIKHSPRLEASIAFGAAEALEDVRSFLASSGPIDAMMCCSDLIAMAAISVLNERGQSVPVDVSITGYDDIQIAQRAAPPLTTISQGIARGGRALVDGLMQRLSGESCSDYVASADLIIRQSA